MKNTNYMAIFYQGKLTNINILRNISVLYYFLSFVGMARNPMRAWEMGRCCMVQI